MQSSKNPYVSMGPSLYHIPGLLHTVDRLRSDHTTGFQAESGSILFPGVFTATKMSFPTARVGDQSGGWGNLGIRRSRRNCFGLSEAAAGCAWAITFRWKVSSSQLFSFIFRFEPIHVKNSRLITRLSDALRRCIHSHKLCYLTQKQYWILRIRGMGYGETRRLALSESEVR